MNGIKLQANTMTMAILVIMAGTFTMGVDGAKPVTLVTFDGAEGTTHTFRELNDPVMGGQSVGSVTVDKTMQAAIFQGECKIVPKLKAPGFIEAWADDKNYADASSAIDGDLVLTVKSTTPEYRGFRVTIAAGALSPSFSCAAGGSIIGSGGCYKAKFNVSASSDWTEVRIPFHSFSDKWSSYTGDQTKTCAQDKRVCITAKKLANIQAIGFWGEGVAGKVNLQIKSVVADPSPSRPTRLNMPLTTPDRPPYQYDECPAAVQGVLKYNLSQFTAKDLTAPVAVSPGESLATAICCDKRTEGYAEPQFLFEAPTVRLLDYMEKNGVTTFYDSVCSLPVFRAPVNRTLASFKADSEATGWPNFRPEEAIMTNLQILDNGDVKSACGTHLGTFFKQDGGRYCIDVSCIAGTA